MLHRSAHSAGRDGDGWCAIITSPTVRCGAIHLKKEEIGELFHEKLGTPAGLSDPKALTEAARHHLRGAAFVKPGGRCAFGEVEAVLQTVPEYSAALKVLSVVPGVSKANVFEVLDPHEYASLDFCVLQGELGVAENAAIWVRDFPNRAAAYLAQHIAIVVSGDALVHNLHEACARLTIGPGFGQFIAGPSKTAVSSRPLVLGAHGARSCTVIVT